MRESIGTNVTGERNSLVVGLRLGAQLSEGAMRAIEKTADNRLAQVAKISEEMRKARAESDSPVAAVVA